MSNQHTIEELNQSQLTQLIERIEQAIEHDLALSVDDLKLLLLAINTLSKLQCHLEEDQITLYKLRKLLGMVTQSESRKKKNGFAKHRQR